MLQFLKYKITFLTTPNYLVSSCNVNLIDKQNFKRNKGMVRHKNKWKRKQALLIWQDTSEETEVIIIYIIHSTNKKRNRRGQA